MIPSLVFVFGLAAAGLLVPMLLGALRSHPEHSYNRPGLWRYLVVAILIVLHPASRFIGIDAWLASTSVRLFIIGNLGVGVSIGYCLFFSLAAPGRKGLLFGLIMTIGIGSRYIVSFFILGMEPREMLEFMYSLTAWLSVVMAVASIVALSFIGQPVKENAVLVNDSRPKRMVYRLILATVLYAVLNGFQFGRLFPFVDAEAVRQFPLLPFCVMAAAPLSGMLLDWDFDVWFKRIGRPCAFVFMMIPTLPLITESSPNIYKTLHSLAVVGDFVLFSTMTVAIERIGGRGRCWCLGALVPQIARALSFALLMARPAFPRLDLGLRTLISILAAVAFYELINFQFRQTGSQKPTSPEDTPPSPEIGEPVSEQTATGRRAPASIPDDVKEKLTHMFQAHNLTERETEVARLLLRGMSNADMAKQLFISEVTVKFHVKNILAKFQVATRGLFIAKVFSSEFSRKSPED